MKAKSISCSCGGEAKLKSKKNYPFGKKSASRTTWFYKCKSCNKVIFLDNSKGGRR